MYKYVGDGFFVPGVPARDLSDKEWADLPEDLRKLAKALHLYEKQAAKKPAAKKSNASNK